MHAKYSMNKNKLTLSTLVSASITTIFILAITLTGELYKVAGADGKMINPIKDYLKSLHGHHWVGKGIWAVALFIIISAIMYGACKVEVTEQKIGKYVSVLSWTLALCTIAFFSFFAYEYIVSH